MRAASDFEFKNRFWIIGGMFGLAFLTYALDHQNAGAAVVEWLARLRGTEATSASYHAIFWFAALLCVMAAWIRTWATAYLNPEVMMGAHVQTARLVADGPYRHVRNPLYFGNILLALGFGLMASRIGFFILVIGMWVFVYRLILREEAGIAAHQGEPYQAYCASVPRLIPSLRPRVPSGGGVPNWADGILGEAFMWVMAGSVIAFAVTLNQTVYFLVLGSAFVVYGICAAIVKTRRQRSAPGAEPPS
jgi:protein-S-isoprenylcysteine O-methyltransferase Ste14